jgi:predicted RND superfamily exporter protein
MMKKLGNKVIEVILKYSLAVIIVTSVITAGALYLLPKIKFDNSVDAFFDKKSKSYINFQAWKEQFGSDDVVIVSFSVPNAFSVRRLEAISHITGLLEQLPYVKKVSSITNVNDIVGADQDFIVRPLVETIPTDPTELAALRERALANPLYLKNVISADGKTVAFIIELEQRTTGGDAYKKETIQDVKRIFDENLPKDKKYYLSGPTAIEYFYASYMQEDFRKFLPIILVIIVAILIFSFRGVIGVLLPMLVVALSLIWTMALLYLCGYSINNVTTVIPPIMLSITLLEAIHFVWELIQRKGKEKLSPQQAEQLIGETIRHLFVPCFLTNVTTVIGFFSLLVTNVPPIRQLGWI